jgi:hypothetical protein
MHPSEANRWSNLFFKKKEDFHRYRVQIGLILSFLNCPARFKTRIVFYDAALYSTIEYVSLVTIHRVIIVFYRIWKYTLFNIQIHSLYEYSVKASISSDKNAAYILNLRLVLGFLLIQKLFALIQQRLFLPFSLHSKKCARFSVMMNFEYSSAELTVNAVMIWKTTKNGWNNMRWMLPVRWNLKYRFTSKEYWKVWNDIQYG